LKRATEVSINPEPLIEILRAPLPAAVLAGSSVVIAGLGLLKPPTARQFPYSPGMPVTIACPLTNPNGGVTPGNEIEKLGPVLRIGTLLSC
jgi:hypothetical protein